MTRIEASNKILMTNIRTKKNRRHRKALKLWYVRTRSLCHLSNYNRNSLSSLPETIHRNNLLSIEYDSGNRRGSFDFNANPLNWIERFEHKSSKNVVVVFLLRAVCFIKWIFSTLTNIYKCNVFRVFSQLCDLWTDIDFVVVAFLRSRRF